jgi:hypothetical protein
LKQSSGQTLLYKILSDPKKTFLFPSTSQKYIQYLSISFPVVYFVTCILKLTFIRTLNLNKTVFFFFWLVDETTPLPTMEICEG